MCDYGGCVANEVTYVNPSPNSIKPAVMGVLIWNAGSMSCECFNTLG